MGLNSVLGGVFERACGVGEAVFALTIGCRYLERGQQAAEKNELYSSAVCVIYLNGYFLSQYTSMQPLSSIYSIYGSRIIK